MRVFSGKEEKKWDQCWFLVLISLVVAMGGDHGTEICKI